MEFNTSWTNTEWEEKERLVIQHNVKPRAYFTILPTLSHITENLAGHQQVKFLFAITWHIFSCLTLISIKRTLSFFLLFFLNQLNPVAKSFIFVRLVTKNSHKSNFSFRLALLADSSLVTLLVNFAPATTHKNPYSQVIISVEKHLTS